MYFYDFPDAYDLMYTPDFREASSGFFKELFRKHDILDVMDCTVGTGQLAIPMARLGYNVTGCDINSSMLRRARSNFNAENLQAKLFQADMLKMSAKTGKEQFDCVMCSGNSLGLIEKNKINNALDEMDKVLRPGGVMYIDSRNWEVIQKRQQRFYLFNPIIRDKGRINYLYIWDYNKNGSITYNILFIEELENKIVSKRQFFCIYHPFKIKLVLDFFEERGYTDVQLCKLGDVNNQEIKEIDWYAITAVKPFSNK